MSLTKNMGSVDRIIRTIAALLFGFLYASGIVPGTLGIVLLVLGIVFLGTSFISFCPLYKPFGIKTCSEEPAN